VGEALEKLHQLAWVASQQRINLDGLILSRVEASPARACRVANALEDVRFAIHLSVHFLWLGIVQKSWPFTTSLFLVVS